MTNFVATPTLDAVSVDVQAFIQGVVPAGTPVLRGPINRASSPKDPYVEFVPLFSKRLRTNIVTDDPIIDGVGTDTATWEQGEELRIQVAFYGPNSGDWKNVFTTLWRSEYGCDNLTTIQPLHADDGHMLPMHTGEEQYLDGWIVTAVAQQNVTVSTPQQYTDTIDIDIISVDQAFPP